MVEYLILPLTKSPHPSGRIGQTETQDWYRGLLKAKSFSKKYQAKILVISNVHIATERHEVEIYVDALKALGIKEPDMVVIKEAQETIGQLEIAAGIAEKERKTLLIISTFLHFLRVWWLCRVYKNIKIRHSIAFGMPRPQEAITDILLTFLFPFFDVVGRRQWFVEKVIKQREKGKHGIL